MTDRTNRRIPQAPSVYIRTMEQLLNVVQKLSASRDMDSVMVIARRWARELTGSDGATFVLRQGNSYFYAEEDAISPLWKGSHFPLKIGIGGWVILNRTPAIIEDVYADPRVPLYYYEKTFVKSMAMVPIRTSAPMGAIGCYWSEKHLATPEEIKVMQVLADTVAIAMDNIHYQNLIAVKARQLEEAMDGTMLTIAKMVELRNLYTSGHQRRVALIGLAVAEALGWPRARCEEVYRAGVVHDIGKIGIPGELLSKPGRLSPHEFALIQTHPQAGYEILKEIPFLLPTARIILQHHERMDGSGYPAGLKGSEIVPEALVLAVADVFESMNSHRPYRPALGTEAAMEELTRNRGILYSPEVVDALASLVEQGYQIPE